MGESYKYEGQELDVFAHAKNWKRYFRNKLRPYINRHVLEVGAGIGTTTEVLYENRHESWTCLEPDRNLANRLTSRVSNLPRHEVIRVRTGTMAGLSENERFDSIIYIDVLEHIEHDAAELNMAASHLKPNGTIVVLSPAHQWLYTPFDKAIGHYRRYHRKSLRAASPPNLNRETVRYLDSVGFAASLANRLMLKEAMPSVRQILFWDRLMVPCSRIVDRLTGYQCGKSIIGVWRKSSD